MTAIKQDPLANEKYLNLETYRKNGQPVLTPVWFAEEKGVFYVYSLANAGKIKRIRNNPRVRIAPCDVRGKRKGEWMAGQARVVGDADAEHGQWLLTQKYGVLKRIGDFFSRWRGRTQAVVAIEVK